jgi:hypothetical protein
VSRASRSTPPGDLGRVFGPIHPEAHHGSDSCSMRCLDPRQQPLQRFVQASAARVPWSADETSERPPRTEVGEQPPLGRWEESSQVVELEADGDRQPGLKCTRARLTSPWTTQESICPVWEGGGLTALFRRTRKFDGRPGWAFGQRARKPLSAAHLLGRGIGKSCGSGPGLGGEGVRAEELRTPGRRRNTLR